MRRLDWFVAGGLVVVGLLFLLAASGMSMGGIGGMGAMGGMMASMRIAVLLFILVLLLAALALIVYLVRTASQEGARARYCANCGRRLQGGWRVCPYCGERAPDGGGR